MSDAIEIRVQVAIGDFPYFGGTDGRYADVPIPNPRVPFPPGTSVDKQDLANDLAAYLASRIEEWAKAKAATALDGATDEGAGR